MSGRTNVSSPSGKEQEKIRPLVRRIRGGGVYRLAPALLRGRKIHLQSSQSSESAMTAGDSVLDAGLRAALGLRRSRRHMASRGKGTAD